MVLAPRRDPDIGRGRSAGSPSNSVSTARPSMLGPHKHKLIAACGPGHHRRRHPHHRTGETGPRAAQRQLDTGVRLSTGTQPGLHQNARHLTVRCGRLRMCTAGGLSRTPDLQLIAHRSGSECSGDGAVVPRCRQAGHLRIDGSSTSRVQSRCEAYRVEQPNM